MAKLALAHRHHARQRFTLRLTAYQIGDSGQLEEAIELPEHVNHILRTPASLDVMDNIYMRCDRHRHADLRAHFQACAHNFGTETLLVDAQTHGGIFCAHSGYR